MKTFKHSGTLGDIVYSLALMKHFGGGDFYLHLNQVDWISKHYYGSQPDPYHQGRMNEQDMEFMQDFFLAQDYITDFKALDPSQHEITHNLDKFRPLFVGHPANYVTTYCMAFAITDQTVKNTLNTDAWLTVPNPKVIEGKPYVINRTSRGFTSPGLNPQWAEWKSQGIDQQSVFVGLPEEYAAFKLHTEWELDHYPTKTMLELAEVIAGADQFVGNQSVALSIAQGLRVPYAFEARKDLPIERNESLFPLHDNGQYF
jgi:ADP-heptose:LPS heptosyltransferase